MGWNASKTADLHDDAQRDSEINQHYSHERKRSGTTQIKIHTVSEAGPSNARNDNAEPKLGTGKTLEHDQTLMHSSQAITSPYEETKSGRKALHQRQCDFDIKHQISRDNTISWVEPISNGQDIPQSLLMIYGRPNRDVLGKDDLLEYDFLSREDTIKLVRMKAQVYLEQMTGIDDKLFEFYFHGKCHNVMDPNFFRCFNVTLLELGRLDTILTNRINTMAESFIYSDSSQCYFFEDDDQIAALLEEMLLENHSRILYLWHIFKLLARYIEYKRDEPVIIKPENRLPRERPSHCMMQRYWDVALWYNADKGLEQIEKDLRSMQYLIPEGCNISDFHNFSYTTYFHLFH